MKKETAKKRITNAINRDYAGHTWAERNYLIEVIMLTWESLELDKDACHDDGTPYTSTENLNYALSTIDDILLEEARRNANV